MTITAETYTTANGSNMDSITYKDSATIASIAADLRECYDNWDYAILTNDDDEIIANIERDETLEIRDFVSGKNVTVGVDAHVETDDGTFYYCTYPAQASTEVDCWFAVIETSDSTMMCQTDWQSMCATPDTIADFEWEDCTPKDDFEDMLDVAETAEMLDVSRQRVHQLLQAGQLDGRKVGKTWYVYRDSVENRLAGLNTR